MNQGDILELMLSRNIPIIIAKLFTAIYDHNKTNFTVNNEKIGEIEIQKGVKQGASTSPILFNMIIDELLKRMKQ